jgi:hypothetical protein
MSGYDKWMARQPNDFQDDVLGENQARLFRSGAIQLRRFKNRRGDALTIRQLRHRDMLTAAYDSAAFPTVAYVNHAKTPLGVDLAQMVGAHQKFLDTLFVPVWGMPAKLIMADNVPEGAWSVIFFDDADSAGAMGYHDLTKDGFPVSKVFVIDTLKGGARVDTTACHELVEMLIDPGAQLWAQDSADNLYAYEVADACEDDEFQIDGVWMSDFLYPAFFEDFHTVGSQQFDYLRKVDRPFQTLKGGYQIVAKLGKTTEKDARLKFEFGSPEKQKSFEAEDRRMHRSETRRARLGDAG